MSNGRFRETLESIGGCLMFAVFAAIPVVLLLAFLKSIGWVVEVLLPILVLASGGALLLVFICLLLSIPRKTRGWAGLGIMLSSYVLGFHLWVWSLVLAVAAAGIFWVVVGIAFAGVGVVVVAAIATAIRGEWMICLQIVVGVIVVGGLRILGAYLIEKSVPKDEDYLTPLPPDLY